MLNDHYIIFDLLKPPIDPQEFLIARDTTVFVMEGSKSA